MVLISYKGQEYNIPYQEDETDRNITMITLNKALAPDYQIRFCDVLVGNYAFVFLPLPAEQWRELEREFGRETITRFFKEITEDTKLNF